MDDNWSSIFFIIGKCSLFIENIKTGIEINKILISVDLIDIGWFGVVAAKYANITNIPLT